MVFITVLHRLFAPGSDRAAERWCRRYALGELGNLDLQHFYRTMGWLGEPVPADQQPDETPLGPRLRKDLIEEALFSQRRDLFTGLRLVFIDTTSIYFEGRGGETIGKRGYSKDHRPDLMQMVVAMVMDDEGRPVCCEVLPGNTADIKTLIPLVDRLRALDGDTDILPDPDRKADDATPEQNPAATFAAMMCKAFPGVSPEYWLTEINAGDARAMLAGVGDEGFATSDARTEAIGNYLKAIKWIWRARSDG